MMRSRRCCSGAFFLWVMLAGYAHAGGLPLAVRLMYPKPMVSAHRACSLRLPENSLMAVKICIGLGIDMAEMDVRYSKDGVPVMMHDEWLLRMTAHPRNVSNYTPEELKKLYLRNPNGTFSQRHAITTLAEVLEVAQGKLYLNLEVKRPHIGRTILEIAKYGAQDTAMITSEIAPLNASFRLAKWMGVTVAPVVKSCGVLPVVGCPVTLGMAVERYAHEGVRVFNVAFMGIKYIAQVRCGDLRDYAFLMHLPSRAAAVNGMPHQWEDDRVNWATLFDKGIRVLNTDRYRAMRVFRDGYAVGGCPQA